MLCWRGASFCTLWVCSLLKYSSYWNHSRYENVNFWRSYLKKIQKNLGTLSYPERYKISQSHLFIPQEQSEMKDGSLLLNHVTQAPISLDLSKARRIATFRSVQSTLCVPPQYPSNMQLASSVLLEDQFQR